MQLKKQAVSGRRIRTLSIADSLLVRIIFLTLACWFGVLSGSAFAQNVLLNGDLSKGTDKAPEGWKTAGWDNSANATSYTWHHDAGATATIEVNNAKPNDSYWFQKIHLAEGWYYVSALIRAEGVSSEGVGANLSIVEDGMISEQFHGTTDWKKVGFYLKIGSAGAELPLGCRLGGFANLSTGKVFCRDLQVAKIESPPASGNPKYDLDAIRGVSSTQSSSASESSGARPPGGANPLGITILVAVTLVLVVSLLWGKSVIPQTAGLLRSLGSIFESTPSERIEAPVTSLGEDFVDAPAPAPEDIPAAPAMPRRLIRVSQTIQPVSPYAPGAVGIGLAVIVYLSIRRLTGTDHEIDFGAAFAGLQPVLTTTGLAALKLWSFWALSTVVVGGLLLQLDPQLELFDAILGGACGVWVIAYFIGQLLGPIHLFRPLTIWLLLAGGIFQLTRNPPRLPRLTLSFGEKLALLAIALLAVSMIPLQLGSPLAPYMDVLSYPASVQRILSFGVYLPFDNDPYGCWGTRAQTPGLELLYAMLAMGSRVRLGVLAQSGVMMPMAALLILATYRLGKTLANDTLGGVASFFLFLDTIFRKLTGMRGTAAAFVLVALGLAFFFDRRRNRILIALGALMLGTSVAAHAIDGGLAVVLAGGGVLLWLADQDIDSFRWGLAILSGTALFALPGVAIGLGVALPYPLLPLSQIAGGAIIGYGAWRLAQVVMPESRNLTLVANLLILFLLAAILYSHASINESTFEQIFGQFPLLSVFAFAGLIAALVADDSFIKPIGVALIALGLLVGIGNEFLKYVATLSSAGTFLSGVGDIGFKVEEYWCPFFMVIAAAIPIAMLIESGPKAKYVGVAALLALVVYPWNPRPHVDDNYNEHSLAWEWGLELRTAASGFWIGTHESRWTLGPADFALANFMENEREAGRITINTHVLHVAHDAIVWRDFNRFSVFTGINDDPVLYEILPSDAGWFAGSRVRDISQLKEALAQRPQYILEQVALPPGISLPDGYREVFNRGDLRLYRREKL